MGSPTPSDHSSETNGDLKTNLQEPLFTFLVGPEEKSFKIRPSIFRNASKALYALMTNGSLRESVEGVAKLPEVEPRTFEHFCEYVYIGNYIAVGSIAHSLPRLKACIHDVGCKQHHCWSCGGYPQGVFRGNFPYCACCERAEEHRKGRIRRRYCVSCGHGVTSYGRYDDTAPIICNECTGATYELSMRALWEHRLFAGIYIKVGAMRFFDVQEYLTHSYPDDVPADNFIAHVKLWIFADMYLDECLKELCLHKLHRDLQAFVLTSNSAPKLAELISCLCEHPSTANDEHDATRSPRAMVHAYLHHKTRSFYRYGPMEPRLSGEEQLLDVLVEEMRQSMTYGC